jgi:hypothetical protein
VENGISKMESQQPEVQKEMNRNEQGLIDQYQYHFNNSELFPIFAPLIATRAL